MKKIYSLFFVFFLFSLSLYSQIQTSEVDTENTSEVIVSDESDSENEGWIPAIVNSYRNLSVRFDEGISYAQLTRIEKMEDRSNFVRENMMLGTYVKFTTVDFSKIDYLIKLSAFYPFYNAFNGMQQQSRNMFNYAINNYFGMVYTDNQLGYVEINYSLGFHYMYQLTDEWKMHYVGLGGAVELAIPLTQHWSIIESNFFSFDNPNVGKNRSIQPFDAAYQFQFDLGVRYSKRCPNAVYIIKGKSKE